MGFRCRNLFNRSLYWIK